MRILVLHGYGLTGSGSAVYTVDLLSALANSGHDVDLICHEADLRSVLPDALHCEADGGWVQAVYRVGPGSVRVHAHAGLEVPVMYTRPELPQGRPIAEWSGEALDSYGESVYAFVERLGQGASWDAMLVNHVAGLCAVADRYSRATTTPWAAIVHGTGLLYGLPHPPLRARVLDALQSCESVVALNGEVRQRVEAAFGSACPPIAEVPPGVDTQRFTRRDEGRAEQVAYAGRLILDKGVHHLLLAWPSVLRRSPGATLEIAGDGSDGLLLRTAFSDLVAGAPGAFAERVIEHANATGRAHLVAAVQRECDELALTPADQKRLRDSVRWRGPLGREDVAALMGTSAVAVLPAVVPEAFPLAVLEATAAGALPVGSQLSGLGWLLRQVEGSEPALRGRLIARTDVPHPVRELAQKIGGLLHEPTLRGRMDHRPRALAERYEWRSIAARLVAVARDSENRRIAAE